MVLSQREEERIARIANSQRVGFGGQKYSMEIRDKSRFSSSEAYPQTITQHTPRTIENWLRLYKFSK
jgi:hypothetical protein